MWYVINKRELINCVFISEDRDLAIHEYLAIIRDEARTLVHAGVKPGPTPHLSVVYVADSTAHRVIEDEAVLDLTTWTIKSIYGHFNDRVINEVLLADLKRLYSEVKKVEVKNEVKKVEVKKAPVAITESKLDLCDFDSNVTLLQTQLAETSNMTEVLLPSNLEQKMLELERIKADKLAELEKLKQIQETDEERATNYAMNLSNIRREQWKAKDQEEQLHNKFSGGCSTYYALKAAIQKEKMTEDTIPILFADQWPIFKWMDERGELELDNAYEIYKELQQEVVNPEAEVGEGIFGEYVPHDINYPERKSLENMLAEISDDEEELPEFNLS